MIRRRSVNGGVSSQLQGDTFFFLHARVNLSAMTCDLRLLNHACLRNFVARIPLNMLLPYCTRRKNMFTETIANVDVLAFDTLPLS